VACAAALALAHALNAQESHIGAQVASLQLQTVDNKSVTFNTIGDKATVVIFFSTRCPISSGFNYRRNVLYKEFSDRANFFVVDPNANESLTEIRNYAGAMEFDFPVFRDVDNALADRLGAALTTDTFVLDSKGIIRYHGYLEDSPNASRTTVPGLRRAIEALLDGRPVAMPEAKARGCAIQRVKSTL